MNSSYVAPERGKTPFHCPHCNVMAQQVWQPLFWKEGLFRQPPPRQGSDEDSPPMRRRASVEDCSASEPDGEPLETKKPKNPPVVTLVLENANMLSIAECQNCKEVSIWLYETMLYPDGYAPPPNSDLDDEIKRDYREAAAIVNKSPRGACALLRLCLQKLCDDLGAMGSNVNDQIGWLVREKNLSAMIQQSLDVVRVIGNEAVHPGEIDLRDDKETALSLFTLINLIADSIIAQPKRIEEMFSKLPESKRKGIEQRDGKR